VLIVHPSSVMNKRRVRETLARKIMGHEATTPRTAIVDPGETMDRTATRRIRRVTLTTGTTTDTNESRSRLLRPGRHNAGPEFFRMKTSAGSPSRQPEAANDERVTP